MWNIIEKQQSPTTLPVFIRRVVLAIVHAICPFCLVLACYNGQKLTPLDILGHFLKKHGN